MSSGVAAACINITQRVAIHTPAAEHDQGRSNYTRAGACTGGVGSSNVRRCGHDAAEIMAVVDVRGNEGIARHKQHLHRQLYPRK